MRRVAAGFAVLLGAVLSFASAAVHADKVTVSLTKSVASAPIFIAQDLGYFAEEGLEVELKYFAGGPHVAIAVASGDADMGITALSAALFNMADRGVLKLIAGGGYERPGYSSVVYLASMEAYEKGLREPRDVEGKVFGATSLGSPGHYALAMLAEKYGFDLSSVNIIPLGGFGNILSAIKGGRVDVGIFPSFAAEAAQARGDGKIIGRVGDETPLQLAAILTTNKVVDDRHAMLERFLSAYREGSATFAAAFQETGSGDGSAPSGVDRDQLVGVLQAYTEMSEEQMFSGMSYIDPEGRLDVEDVRNQIASWIKLDAVRPDTSVDAIIAHTLVRPLPAE